MQVTQGAATKWQRICMTIDRGPWTFNQALCREIGVEPFFAPDKDEVNDRPQTYDAARRICHDCVHKLDCAEWGIHFEIHGMWGGLSPKERQRIRSKRNIRIPITVIK